MTHVSCPTCRLRFARAAAGHLLDCPACGGPLVRLPGGEAVLGFRLAPHDTPAALRGAAAAVSLPDPDAPDRAP